LELSILTDCGLPSLSAYFGGVATDDGVFLSAASLNFTRGGVVLDGAALLICGTMMLVPDVFLYIGIDNMSANSVVYLQRPMPVIIGFANFYRNTLCPGGALLIVEQGTFVVYSSIFCDNAADSEFRIIGMEGAMDALNTFQVINCVFSRTFVSTSYVSRVGCIDRSLTMSWQIPGLPSCSTKDSHSPGFSPSRQFAKTGRFSPSRTLTSEAPESDVWSSPFPCSRTLLRERGFNGTVPPALSGGAQSDAEVSFLVGSAVGLVALMAVFAILLAKAWTGGISKCRSRPELAPDDDVEQAEVEAETPGLYRETQMMDRMMERAIRSWEGPDIDETTF
jgi:hypothetical protein